MPASLPLSRVIDAVYGRLFGNLGAFLRVALAWIAVTVVLIVALAILAPQAWDGPGGSFITAVIGAGTAIGWHRFVLREERRAFSGANTLARYVLLAVVAVLPGAAIVLIGIPAIAALLRGLDDRAGAAAITAVIILLAVVGAAVTFRLSLILPAVAIGDRSMTFRRSWAATRGNVARIFVGCIVVQIPPWLGIGLLTWLLERWQGLPTSAEPDAGDYVFAVIAAVLLLLLSALATALFAGFLSELYLRLYLDPEDPAPLS
ncbi:hypothetical protein [Inquilinus sp. CA228]|uniref:hypothetical protein n=1 Tax=Inquilinus sp. CA228 TaxID=3455609 RepID=UPI003F8D73BA